MSSTKQHFCNECKYYCPVGHTNGLCSCEFPSGLFIHHFYDKSCTRGFKPNIGCWYVVESPEFMEVYERNIEIKIKLRLEINTYKYAQQLSQEIDKEIIKRLIKEKKLANTPEPQK